MLLAIISIAYLVFVLPAGLAAWLWPSADIRGLAAAYVSPPSTLAPLILIPNLIAANWLIAALLIAPIIQMIRAYHHLIGPRTTPPDPTDAAFSILTFNIKGDDVQPEDLVERVRAADADIIAFQELSIKSQAIILERLGGHYPHQALHAQQESPYIGQGIISHFPITEDEFWRNENIEDSLGHQQTTLQVHEDTITIFNTHPVPPFSFDKGLKIQAHGREIDILLERAEENGGQTIILGDFNMTDKFEAYSRITQDYTDALRQAAESWFSVTFPKSWRLPIPPVIRLDFVFCDDSFVIHQAEVLQDAPNSDHWPIRVDLSTTAQVEK